MATCSRCNGLIAEPGKAYSYSGKFCHCAWAASQGPINPGPQQDIKQVREDEEASRAAKETFLKSLQDREAIQYKETVNQIMLLCTNLSAHQLRLLIDVLKALHDCQAIASKPGPFKKKKE